MRFEVAAAHEEDRAAVGCEGNLVDLLSVVIAIVGELPALVIWRFGGPEIARAFLIEHPGDRAAFRSGCKIGRERRAHNLIECEAFRGSRKSDRTGNNSG